MWPQKANSALHPPRSSNTSVVPVSGVGTERSHLLSAIPTAPAILISSTQPTRDDRGPQHFRLLLAGVRESREGFQVRMSQSRCLRIGIIQDYVDFLVQNSELQGRVRNLGKTRAIQTFTLR